MRIVVAEIFLVCGVVLCAAMVAAAVTTWATLPEYVHHVRR
jgi:hypothetical protein